MGTVKDFIASIQTFGLEAYGRYYSVYQGKVIDNADSSYLGRLRVQVPLVHGEQTPETWAYPKGLPAGANWGLYAIPPVGGLVWVTFAGGDPQYPLWEAGSWNQNAPVPAAGRTGPDGQPLKNPNVFLFQSPAGHRWEINDQEGYVRWHHKGGRVIELRDKTISLGQASRSKEPAVLGEALNKLLQGLLEAVTQLTVTGPLGTSSTPVNTAAFSQLIGELKNHLSTIVTLD